MIKKKDCSHKSHQLLEDLFVHLINTDTSLVESWFLATEGIPHANPKLCIRMKKKTNFIVLFDLFIQEESNAWLYFLLELFLKHIKQTYISPIDNVRLQGKFEVLFKTFEIDLFFPNAYNFMPFVKLLLEQLDVPSDAKQTVYSLRKVKFLHSLFEIVNIVD